MDDVYEVVAKLTGKSDSVWLAFKGEPEVMEGVALVDFWRRLDRRMLAGDAVVVPAAGADTDEEAAPRDETLPLEGEPFMA